MAESVAVVPINAFPQFSEIVPFTFRKLNAIKAKVKIISGEKSSVVNPKNFGKCSL